MFPVEVNIRHAFDRTPSRGVVKRKRLDEKPQHTVIWGWYSAELLGTPKALQAISESWLLRNPRRIFQTVPGVHSSGKNHSDLVADVVEIEPFSTAPGHAPSD